MANIRPKTSPVTSAELDCVLTTCRVQAQCAALRPDIQPLAGHGVGSSDDFFAALVNAVLRHTAQLVGCAAPSKCFRVAAAPHRHSAQVVLDRWDQA